jgi:tRNA-specific 2-thiouridylase
MTNTITLGRRKDLETTTIELERATFIAGHPPAGHGFRAEVRIRHRTTAVPAMVRRVVGVESSVRWLVETDTPIWAAAPGQAAVLYDGEVVLGGGRIARPTTAAPEAMRHDIDLVGSGV